jgi:hypothetical protein
MTLQTDDDVEGQIRALKAQRRPLSRSTITRDDGGQIESVVEEDGSISQEVALDFDAMATEIRRIGSRINAGLRPPAARRRRVIRDSAGLISEIIEE